MAVVVVFGTKHPKPMATSTEPINTISNLKRIPKTGSTVSKTFAFPSPLNTLASPVTQRITPVPAISNLVVLQHLAFTSRYNSPSKPLIAHGVVCVTLINGFLARPEVMPFHSNNIDHVETPGEIGWGFIGETDNFGSRREITNSRFPIQVTPCCASRSRDTRD